MKTHLLSAAFIIIQIWGAAGQAKPDDFGRIILNTYLPEGLTIPAESRSQLSNKLTQIAAQNGMGGSSVNPRFIITANVNILTRDIVPGPPQMIAQNLEVMLYIGDALTNTVFASAAVPLKGVGTNENKAFIEAFKLINPKNPQITSFLTEGKNKIIGYYSSQCDFMAKDARTLAAQGQYDEAIYRLSLVPEVCQDCYFKSLDQMTEIFQQKIDADGKVKLAESRTVWAAAQNPEGAEKAGDILGSIHPQAACQPEVAALMKVMEAKLKADERARWQFKMKQYEDKVAADKEAVRIAEEKSKRDDQFRENQASRNLELDKLRVSAYRDIAVEQAKNQPKTVTYNNIYWR